MIIRGTQIKSLQDAAEASFLDRLVILVSEEGSPPEPGSRDACRQLIERARTWNLDSEFEVGAYVVCGILIGMDFDDRKDLPFRRILSEPETESRLKAAQIAVALEQLTDGGPREE